MVSIFYVAFPRAVDLALPAPFVEAFMAAPAFSGSFKAFLLPSLEIPIGETAFSGTKVLDLPSIRGDKGLPAVPTGLALFLALIYLHPADERLHAP